MSFLEAMDNGADEWVLTENGRPAYPSVGERVIDKLLELDQKLSRNVTRQEIETIFEQVVEVSKPSGGHSEDIANIANIANLFVVFFNARDPRGGKGERDASFHLFALLSKQYPQVALALIPLLPRYGCWQDIRKLHENGEVHEEVRARLLMFMAEQLRQDYQGVTQSTEDEGAPPAAPSLAAKWAPREKSKDTKGVEFAKLLAAAVFPDDQKEVARPKYRKLLSAINASLGTPEINMCNGTWSHIVPSAVPATCLRTKRKALLNEKNGKSGKNSKKGRKESKDGEEPQRRSEDPDRVECEQHFRKHLEDCKTGMNGARVHGRQQHPHEMVKHYFPTKASQGEDPVLEAQWKDMRDRCQEQFGEGLGKLVPLVDVSGSMSCNGGTPMQVAVALGILLSEVVRPEFRHRFITFETNPRWHKLVPEQSLYHKVKSTLAAGWGGSTDFSKAMRMLLDVCKQHKVPAEEVAELQLVVFSDMQFDAAVMPYGNTNNWGANPYGTFSSKPQGASSSPADRKWETQYQEIVANFAKAGYDQVPRITFWNLRGDTDNFPVRGDTPGVDMVSGFDANMFKMLVQGELDAASRPDPSQTFREKVLEDERYAPVKAKVFQVLKEAR